MNFYKKIQEKFLRDGFLSTVNKICRYPFEFSRRNEYKKMLQINSISDRFSKIYEKNLWNSKESSSGEGSELSYTQPLRQWLITKLIKHNVKVLVDAPCGDFNWMRKVLENININYIGVDIVSSVIEKNKIQYGGGNNIHFLQKNICEDTLPKCDILMVRDCLFHLSYTDIDRFLKNISNVDYLYLLTTTHIVNNKFTNKNITTGDYRTIDLFSHPFNFDKNSVVDRVDDFPEGCRVQREMILVKKINVPKSISYNV